MHPRYLKELWQNRKKADDCLAVGRILLTFAAQEQRNNMRGTRVHTGTVVRFKRWSRKRYAAFCSVGRVVTIGHVCKSIADASMSKQGWTACMQGAWSGNAAHSRERAEEDAGGGGEAERLFADALPVAGRDCPAPGDASCIIIRYIHASMQTGLCLPACFFYLYEKWKTCWKN